MAEVLAEALTTPVKFKRVGLPSAFSSYVGSQEFLLGKYGLSVDHVVTGARSLITAS